MHLLHNICERYRTLSRSLCLGSTMMTCTVSLSLDCHNAMDNGMHSAIHKDNLHMNTIFPRLPCDRRLVSLDRPPALAIDPKCSLEAPSPPPPLQPRTCVARPRLLGFSALFRLVPMF